MKRIVIALLFLPFCLTADCFMAQLRWGNFYPDSDYIREVYHKSGNEFESEIAFPLTETWSVWFNGNYFRQSRSGSDGEEQSKLHLVPLSTGLKMSFLVTPYSCVYLGLGGSYSWLSTTGNRECSKSGWGAVGKSGFLLYFAHYFFVDLFADYYYTHISSKEGFRTLGGLRTGIGAGVTF